MKAKSMLLILFSLLMVFGAKANDTTHVEQTFTNEQLQAMYKQYVDSVEQALVYEQGRISIGDDLATIDVPPGFKYLNGKDSEMILTDIWGNPPSEAADRSLGMLIPKKDSPMTDSSFVINITFSEEGYIDDSDAKEMDYDDLLSTMQEDTENANSYRVEQGYLPIILVGWASSPFYDAENKKLHWAKELKFGDYDENTLNYNIRVLGRRGFLQLNAIGEMYVLEDVKNSIKPILSSVNFNDGHQYKDFDPGLDRVAAVGIGGLIAGKVLAKAGVLAKLGVMLAKFWKVIAVVLIGFFAGIRKLFGGKDKEGEEPEATA